MLTNFKNPTPEQLAEEEKEAASVANAVLLVLNNLCHFDGSPVGAVAIFNGIQHVALSLAEAMVQDQGEEHRVPLADNLRHTAAHIDRTCPGCFGEQAADIPPAPLPPAAGGHLH